MPQRIDLPLLRRRAEHNEGIVSTLREVTLHQFDIERIENLDVFCRRLQILFLQNNLISKIENLHKLKDLEYLNLAVNNIRRIENLDRCESLTKLDLTLNFIGDLVSVEELKANGLLKELYLVGNPCAKLEGYREYVIGALPQLKVLDGLEITPEERKKATIDHEATKARIVEQLSALPAQLPEPSSIPTKDSERPEAAIEHKRERFRTEVMPFTPQSRLETARDLADLKAAATPSPDTLVTGPNGIASLDPPKTELNLHLMRENRGPYQRNDGKWNFRFVDRHQTLGLEVDLDKDVHVDQLEVDVHETWIRFTLLPVKKETVSAGFQERSASDEAIPGAQYLQLMLPCEVDRRKVVAERSKASGKMTISMMKKRVGSLHADLDTSNTTLGDIVAEEEAKTRQEAAKESVETQAQRIKEEKERKEKARKSRRNFIHEQRMQLAVAEGDEIVEMIHGTAGDRRRRTDIQWESTAPMSMLKIS